MEGESARQKRRGRSGQAVVEFALVLPLFLLLLFAAVEFGRAYFHLHLLTNASREGARVGSLLGKLNDDVTNAVDSFMNGVEFSDTWTTTVVVEDPDGAVRSGGLADSAEGDRIYVTVHSDFHVIVGDIVPGLGNVVPLNGRCAFRRG